MMKDGGEQLRQVSAANLQRLALMLEQAMTGLFGQVEHGVELVTRDCS